MGADGGASLPGKDLDPASHWERRLQQEDVRQVLQELRRQASPCSYRAFHMRWIEGCTVAEIAAALGITEKQVRWRHHP